ncbi:MAG: MFS transporter [Rhodospirillales bacterium]|jgi:MFS family permease|nr:MFS transporter [Rhodospirillales bacterium]
MRQIISSISALLAGSAILNLGSGLLGTVIALRMAVAGFPALVVGGVTSAYFVGYVLGVFYAYHLVARVGHIRSYAALASVLAVSALMHPFLVEPLFWAGLRFVQGFCLAGLAVCTESWLNERATNDIRGRVLSIYMIAIYVALVAGQLLLNLPDPTGFGLFIIPAALMSLALVPVATTRILAPTPRPTSRFGFRELWSISPLGVTGAVASGVILSAFYGLTPYFAQLTGLGTEGTSRLMAAAIAGGLLGQWPIGRLSDRMDRRLVLLGVALATAAVGAVAVAGFVVPASAAHASVLMLGLAPVLGIAIFTIYPLSVAHTNDFIDPIHLVPASAGMILAYGLGAIVGPGVAAGLMSVIGPIGLFVFFGGAGLATAAFTLWRIRQRAAPPIEDRDPFHLVTRTTPLAAGLDPRGEAEEPMFEFTMPDEPASQDAADPKEAVDEQT